MTFFFILLIANFTLAQTWTTGEVSFTTEYTVQFDINEGTGMVTMTMVGPDDKWLGVGLGIEEYMTMGATGDDVVVFSENGIEDRRMTGVFSAPKLDVVSQDWEISSNNTTGGVRTLIATRAINTGDPEDFVFPTVAGTFPILWAVGLSLSFPVQHANRGEVVAGIVLGTPEFEKVLSNISIIPNPATNNLNVRLPESIANKELTIEVYDVLGKQVIGETINRFKSSINVANWNSGLYLVRLSSQEENTSVTKRFVKL